ncbi:MAG: PAS domain S-box protein, partial [Pseudomonadota bacterium]
MKFWTKFTITQSLAVIYITIVLLAGGIEVASLFNASESQKESEQLANSISPTVTASTQALNGLAHTLSLLKSWVSLGEENYREAFLATWEKEIHLPMNILSQLSSNWESENDRQLLNDIKLRLPRLESLQKDVLSIAQTEENSQGLKLFLEQVVPAGEDVAKNITKLIDLEAEEPLTEVRKALFKNMADMRGSLGLSMSAVRAYLINGDIEFSNEFSVQWAKNDTDYELLREKANLLTDAQLPIYESMTSSRAALIENTRKVIGLRSQLEWNIAQNRIAQQITPLNEELKSSLQALLESQQARLTAGIKAMNANAQEGKSAIWSRFLPGFFILSILFLFIRFIVIRQVGSEPREIQQIAQRVAGGDLSDIETHNRSLTGVREVIQQMIENLRNAAQASENSDWIKTNRADLNDTLRGEQNLAALGSKIITFLANSTDARVGTFYLLREQDGENLLKLFASHAYFWRKDASDEFRLGEGLVGQAALEGKSMMLSQVPEDYMPIKSGLGTGVPAQLLIMPFFYEDTLEGVIELAKFGPFTDLQLELLEQIVPSLGSAVYTAEAGSRMQELLTQSQTQAEELQSQSEELQSQSEELRQANEELAEHMNELEQQRNEMRANQRRLTDLMNNVPGVIYQVTPDGIYRFISEGIVDLSGYQAEEVVGQPSYFMHHPDEKEIVGEKAVAALKKNQPYRFIHRMRGKTGEDVWVLNQGRGVRDEETNKFIYTEGFFNDITELKIAQEKLEKSNQYKSEFLANMSHELRTPLNS